MELRIGARVRVRSATGGYLDRRACSQVEPGHLFPVVWVCREEEWVDAEKEGRTPGSVPWPAEDVWGGMSDETEPLRDAIRRLHGCESRWLEAVAVTETFEGRTVWSGTVQVFDLEGHPEATRCYAWSHVTDEGKTRYVAVLHVPPVDSPETAVRAAIVQEFRSSTE